MTRSGLRSSLKHSYKYDGVKPKVAHAPYKPSSFATDPYSRLSRALNKQLSEEQKDDIRMDLAGRPGLEEDNMVDITFMKVLLKAKMLFGPVDVGKYLKEALCDAGDDSELMRHVETYEISVYGFADEKPSAERDVSSSESSDENGALRFDRNLPLRKTSPPAYSFAQEEQTAPAVTFKTEEPALVCDVASTISEHTDDTLRSQQDRNNEATSLPVTMEFESDRAAKGVHSDETSDVSTDTDGHMLVSTEVIGDAPVAEAKTAGIESGDAKDTKEKKTPAKKEAKQKKKGVFSRIFGKSQ